MKTEGSHVLSHPAANAPPSAVQRAVLNRHNQNRRALSGSTTKPLRPQQPNPQPPRSHSIQTAPPPVPSKSPHEQAKAGMADPKAQQRHQPSIQPRTHPQQGSNQTIPRSSVGMHPMTPSTPDGSNRSDHGSHGSQPNFYPPEYQAHLDQLGK